MSAKIIQKVYVAVAFDGRKSWEARRITLEVVDQLEAHLRQEGFEVLNFQSQGLPFDPLASEDTIGSFIELADLVVDLEGEPFAGLGEIAAVAVKRHNAVTKSIRHFLTVNAFA